MRSALLCAAAWLGWAHGVAEDPRTTFSTLVTALSVFVFLPIAMGLAICAMAVVPATVLAPAAVVARATGRRSGLGELLLRILAIGGAVPPGYLRALRRVSSPLVWGCIWGSFGAFVLLGLSLANNTSAA